MFHSPYSLITEGVRASGKTLKNEGGVRIDRLSFSWDKENAPKELSFSWVFQDTDIAGKWTPHGTFDHRKFPEWGNHALNRSNTFAPVFSYFNEAGINQGTFALSEILFDVCTRSGVVEETGEIRNTVTVTPAHFGDTDHYEIDVYFDSRPIPFYRAIQDISRWYEDYATPLAVPEAAKKPLYSTWYNFHKYITTESIVAECEMAAKMGFKTLIIDDGWHTEDFERDFRYAGDWHLATKKIPDMKELVDRVHALGMKVMLWFSVPLLGTHSELYKKWKETSLYYNPLLESGTLDPRYRALREHMKNAYVRALTEWGLDGLKLDFIDSPCEKEEFPYKEGMDEISVSFAIDKMMQEITDAIHAVRPDALIEFRQAYIGPTMRKYGNMFRVADCPYDYVTNRVSMVDLRMLSGNTAVHSDMLMWDPKATPEAAARQILNVLFSVLQYSMKLGELPKAHIQMSDFWVTFMKEHEALLLDAPIMPEAPMQLYPAIRTEAEGETVIAVYVDHYAPEVRLDFSKIMLVNATHSDTLLLRIQGEKDVTVTGRDCMGNIVSEEKMHLTSAPTVLSVPESGLLIIE